MATEDPTPEETRRRARRAEVKKAYELTDKRIEAKKAYEKSEVRKEYNQRTLGQRRARYAANPDKQKADSAAYRDANVEKLKAYRAANADKRQASQKAWNRANADYIRRRDALKYIENREALLAATRNRMLIRKYGMSALEVDALLQKQGGVCAICGTSKWGKKGAHVDHDHKTGAVRGMLCVRCNNGLAHFGDNIKVILSAIDYLNEATPATET